MAVLRFVLGDQLTPSLSSLRDADPQNDIILMCEVAEEAGYVAHHKQKIAFLFSAMRHFASELEDRGFTVRYTKLDDDNNAGSFGAELGRAVDELGVSKVVVTEPGEFRVLEAMRNWETELGIDVEIRDDDRFICSHNEFQAWADGRKELRMEYFYRQMRRKTGFLMEGDDPIGGQWNFDKENRKSLPKDMELPAPYNPQADDITKDVLELVADRFAGHFGRLEGFSLPVTRTQALRGLDRFIKERLPLYGDYQDAMKQGEPTLFHALIAPALNAGLLLPMEICERAEKAHHAGEAPLNAVEGFIRQIIGWREYVRGIYWLKMPDYAQTNFLKAKRDLPEFYWSADTEMNCVRQVVEETRDHAYAHHIQRLMVTGNFALLYGVEPAQINEWYLAVYADAYEWVQLPNTHGMVMFADGGLLGSKPYAASGSYINKMSDYCKNCAFSPSVKNGEKACPFNYLYWNFLIENQAHLKGNRRMAMMYATLGKMDDSKRSQIEADAAAFFEKTGA
ncbi:cryptochrome/photolyase family protein [Pararhizobium sp. IMCC21322]|uniref:cryptochrome/photolyase family protein n=1 Tax=Pararhizobium sp. IMCC21322 TaxID=3067903 RepID=UPI002742426B|nr:cryptochrome/photolyase family protein [Pararhizobium sp. IMCC21322]